jgi:hypothetical protein
VLHTLELPPGVSADVVPYLAASYARGIVRTELGAGHALRVATDLDPVAWPLACPLAELPRVAWWVSELAGVLSPNTTGTPYRVAKVRGRGVTLSPKPAPGALATLVAYLDPLSSSPPAWAGWLPRHPGRHAQAAS